MHHPTPYGASAYRAIGLETGVDATDPLGLVVMLYDGAIQAIVRAENCLALGQIGERGVFTSKAIDIVKQGLSASLDMRVGGTLSDSLWSLYEYMGRRLLVANMTADVAVYAEVRRLLSELRDSWQELRDKEARGYRPPAAVQAQSTAGTGVRDPLGAYARRVAA